MWGELSIKQEEGQKDKTEVLVELLYLTSEMMFKTMKY
jgi:hypothetical protein